MSKYSVQEFDPIFRAELILMGAGALALGIQVFQLFFAVQLTWFGIVGMGLLAVTIPAFVTFFPFISPAELGVRQFVTTKYFTNCRVFHLAPFSELTRIPGDKLIEFTDKEEGKQHSVKSAVRLGKQYGGKDANDAIHLFFVLKVVFRLDILKLTQAVVETYLRDFSGKNGHHIGTRKVSDQVLDIVVARSDEILQGGSLSHFLHKVREANARLQKSLEDELKAIGVELVQITIEEVRDVGGSGTLSEVTRATNAKAKAEADKAVALADKEARLTEAASHEEATKREQKMIAEIAVSELAATKKKTLVERELAKLVLEKLKARLNLLSRDGAQTATLFSKLEQLSPTEVTSILRQAAESLGLEAGGSIVGLGDIRNLHPFVAVLESILRARGVVATTP